MTIFTLYRADVHDSFKSGSVVVSGVIYYLDGDINNWDSIEEYVLPEGWMFVSGEGEDFSYLTTKNNEVIEGRDIEYSKTHNAAVISHTVAGVRQRRLLQKVIESL